MVKAIVRNTLGVLGVMVVLTILLVTVADRGPWTYWVPPMILGVIGSVFFTWLREQRKAKTAV